MTVVQGEMAFKQRLNKILEDQETNEPAIPPRLQEKGVECTILVPMFEYLLGYDPVDDIQYEETSTEVFHQRFDFLLDHRFVVESKALDSPITKREVEQISKYIAQNDEINYGMLSNGLEYVFLVQKSFIENVANSGEAIVGATRPVYNVLTVSATDDKFLEIMSLFSRSSYHEVFTAIAKYVFRQLVPKKGPTSPIASDRDLDEYIKDLIEQKMDFKRGYYLDKIRAGEYVPGQTLKYEDKYISVSVELQPDGTVKLPQGGIRIKDTNAILADGEFKPLINLLTEWYDSEQFFEDPKDIFRKATGKQKVSSKYEFQP